MITRQNNFAQSSPSIFFIFYPQFLKTNILPSVWWCCWTRRGPMSASRPSTRGRARCLSSELDFSRPDKTFVWKYLDVCCQNLIFLVLTKRLFENIYSLRTWFFSSWQNIKNIWCLWVNSDVCRNFTFLVKEIILLAPVPQFSRGKSENTFYVVAIRFWSSVREDSVQNEWIFGNKFRLKRSPKFIRRAFPKIRTISPIFAFCLFHQRWSVTIDQAWPGYPCSPRKRQKSCRGKKIQHTNQKLG